MKKLLSLIVSIMLMPLSMMAAEGWPANYGGVMLQGFYWDSFTETQWKNLEHQADELSQYFSLIWIPQSGYCGGLNMGYTPQYYFRQDSSFGTEAELRSMIKTFNEKGTGMIADVVINHRNNLGTNGSWVDFPSETYGGTAYKMLSTDICSNDDGGKTKSWASSKGLSLSSNTDTGDDWDGCRDLDHKSANVQTIVKAYLKYLLEDLGYAGFRYDMVKGYSASFTGIYNNYANPTYSVGEYWDGNPSTVQNWMNGTKVGGVIQSGAFDFSFRYSCRDAAHGTTQNLKPGAKVSPNWAKLNSYTSVSDPNYSRYSITFVENHDTEYRSASASQDPIVADTLALNAWLLANPGTPCVFLKHWIDCKRDIKMMIEARKLVGITNQSSYVQHNCSAGSGAREINGTNGSLFVIVGKDCKTYNVPDGYKELFSGYHYRYLVSASCNTSAWESIVQRIEEEESQTPEEYFDTPEPGYSYTAYFVTPAEWKNPIMCWAWNKSTGVNYTGGSWPGTKCQRVMKADDGRYVWQWCYYGTVTTPPSHIIFNNSGSSQTADMVFTNEGWYQSTSTQSEPSLGIADAVMAGTQNDDRTYNLSGQTVSESYKGIVVKNGRKYIRKH